MRVVKPVSEDFLQSSTVVGVGSEVKPDFRDCGRLSMARLGNVTDDIDDRLVRYEMHGDVMQGVLQVGCVVKIEVNHNLAERSQFTAQFVVEQDR